MYEYRIAKSKNGEYMLRNGMFLADRYEILEQIGTGGMSDVYKAKCHKLNRFVAIKVLKNEFSQDKTFVTKFRAEAQSAAGLTHPNIVSVYDVGDEDGIYYIVMELVEGITLKKYIEKRGKVPYKEAVSIAIQVAKGMEAAHSHHIVHRDIKPQNIIISKDGKVKVTDFGIAKAASSSTINSVAMGSVHYISPEQARGGYSDERTDIYSLGITLFEMITGTVPFDGDSSVSVAVRHIQDEIPVPSTVTEDVPISIDKIILKCVQKKTERRYQTATELISDLKKSLVMPESDFVKMMPVYANNSNERNLTTDMVGFDNYDDDEDEDIEDDLQDSSEEDDDYDNDLVDDDEDDYDDDDKELDIPLKKHKKVDKKVDDYDDDDIGDENNEKLDKVFKWIGVGIVSLIAVITVIVLVRLFAGNSSPAKENDTTQQIDNTQNTTSNVKDKDKVPVPDVVGKTEEEAKQMLNDVGLGYKSVQQASTTVPEGIVISQGTVKGTKVAKNTTITLSISTGQSVSSVPNVVGSDQINASEVLEAAGFKVSVRTANSDTVEAGKVISQSPAGLTEASPGATVVITVSVGKAEAKTATVPNVLGKSESEARQALDAAGLKVEVDYNPNVEAFRGVFSQSIAAGETVEIGKVISISIGTGAEQTEPQTPQPTDAPQSTTPPAPPATTPPVGTTPPAADNTPAAPDNNAAGAVTN